MDALFTALLMLWGLGTAVLATTAEKKLEVAALAIAFAASSALGLGREVGLAPAWMGLSIAGVAALRVFKPKIRLLAPVCAGLLAAMGVGLLETRGLTTIPALLVTGSLLAVSVACTVKLEAFAPESLREEALLALAALGLAVAAIPEIVAGWQSALVLNRDAESIASPLIANWIVVLSGASATLGSLFAFWRRR